MRQEFEIAIVGTGFSGINMAINLLKNQYQSLVIFEKSPKIGGVWRDNVYPGCTCDIRASLYSIKSEPNPDWTSSFPSQTEILDYLEAISGKYGLESYIQFGTEIKEMVFDQPAGVWNISGTQGNYRVKTVILATGPQRLPYIPAISGLEIYRNKSFHSVNWDHRLDLTGLNVAVVGTGASSIQIVPSIQPRVSQLLLFQSTPAWILPRMKRRTFRIERWLFKKIPLLLKVKRGLLFLFYEFIGSSFFGNKLLHRTLTILAKLKLRLEVRNKTLRKKLKPDYHLGCKRILVSDDFYKALSQPNVSLVTDRIDHISTNAIHTAADEYQVDLIIFGTGFTVADLENYIEIIGLESTVLKKCWAEKGPEAYFGINVSRFPNLCYLLGPNSGLSHSSALHAMESQVNYVLQYLSTLKELPESAYLDVKPDIQRTYNETIQHKLKNTIWASGCTSWFLNKRNKNTVIFPGNLRAFRNLTKKFKIEDYTIGNEGP